MKKVKSAAASLFILALILTVNARAGTPKNDGHWVSAWSAAVHAPLPFTDLPASPVFENQTIRMVVRPTMGGERLRVRLSNAFGTTATMIGAAHVALVSKGAEIVPQSDRVLTFSGSSSIAIPPGAPVLSDPVDLKVPAFAELAISLYLPEKTSGIIHALLGAARDVHFWAGRLHGTVGDTESLDENVVVLAR